jgi:hypothetical protein
LIENWRKVCGSRDNYSCDSCSFHLGRDGRDARPDEGPELLSRRRAFPL